MKRQRVPKKKKEPTVEDRFPQIGAKRAARPSPLPATSETPFSLSSARIEYYQLRLRAVCLGFKIEAEERRLVAAAREKLMAPALKVNRPLPKGYKKITDAHYAGLKHLASQVPRDERPDGG